MERMLLELYDRVYLAWLATNDDNVIGPKVTSDAVYQMWDSFTLNMHKATGKEKNSEVFFDDLRNK